MLLSVVGRLGVAAHVVSLSSPRCFWTISCLGEVESSSEQQMDMTHPLITLSMRRTHPILIGQIKTLSSSRPQQTMRNDAER